MSSFDISSEGRTPLDLVAFDKTTRRYQVTDAKSRVTTDDAIAQAMVAVLLYRMCKGWGVKRYLQSLSIWGGTPAPDDDDECGFPLENLWKRDIKEWISCKKLGLTTLCHGDNFDTFHRLYGAFLGRWARRSNG